MLLSLVFAFNAVAIILLGFSVDAVAKVLSGLGISTLAGSRIDFFYLTEADIQSAIKLLIVSYVVFPGLLLLYSMVRRQNLKAVFVLAVFKIALIPVAWGELDHLRERKSIGDAEFITQIAFLCLDTVAACLHFLVLSVLRYFNYSPSIRGSRLLDIFRNSIRVSLAIVNVFVRAWKK